MPTLAYKKRGAILREYMPEVKPSELEEGLEDEDE